MAVPVAVGVDVDVLVGVGVPVCVGVGPPGVTVAVGDSVGVTVGVGVGGGGGGTLMATSSTWTVSPALLSAASAMPILTSSIPKAVDMAVLIFVAAQTCVPFSRSANDPVVVVESTRSEDDMRALFREEVKPRLAKRPQVGKYNQEI